MSRKTASSSSLAAAAAAATEMTSNGDVERGKKNVKQPEQLYAEIMKSAGSAVEPHEDNQQTPQQVIYSELHNAQQPLNEHSYSWLSPAMTKHLSSSQHSSHLISAHRPLSRRLQPPPPTFWPASRRRRQKIGLAG